MSAASSVVLTSPTTSFDWVSSGSDGEISDLDEEIVWRGPVSSSSESSTESSVESDSDDYVLLSRANSSARLNIGASPEQSEGFSGISDTASDLSIDLSNLSIASSVPSLPLQPLGAGIERPSSTATITQATAPTRTSNRSLPVVDDESSDSDTSESSTSTVSDYEQASGFMTLFLSQPTGKAKDSVCKLTVLHSLIVELGILPTTSDLPKSVKASKALLHSQAHINIKDYIAVREQGQAALQKVMLPSRNALVKNIRKKGNRAPVKWVKEKGLNGLLVTFQG